MLLIAGWCAAICAALGGCGRRDFDPITGADAIADSSSDAIAIPLDAPSPNAVAEIVAGGKTSCARLFSGADVWCWGSPDLYRLGNGATAETVPMATKSLAANAIAIDLDDAGACAVIAGGGLVGWSFNGDGQIGDGTTNPAASPTAATSIASVSACSSSGGLFAMRACAAALSNAPGKGSTCLGDGVDDDRPTFAPVGMRANVQAITTGAAHACALLADGSVSCWGDNSFNQLGGSAPPVARRPRRCRGRWGRTWRSRPATTTRAGATVTVASIVGALNSFAQLGNSPIGGSQPNAAPVVGLDDALQITAGATTACALRADHSVTCWGDNTDGELAQDPGMLASSPQPLAIAGVSDVVQVNSRTDLHICALERDGSVWCWGDNNVGQIGDGTISGIVDVPTRVMGLP